jgi:hypothetical protein
VHDWDVALCYQHCRRFWHWQWCCDSLCHWGCMHGIRPTILTRYAPCTCFAMVRDRRYAIATHIFIGLVTARSLSSCRANPLHDCWNGRLIHRSWARTGSCSLVERPSQCSVHGQCCFVYRSCAGGFLCHPRSPCRMWRRQQRQGPMGPRRGVLDQREEVSACGAVSNAVPWALPRCGLSAYIHTLSAYIHTLSAYIHTLSAYIHTLSAYIHTLSAYIHTPITPITHSCRTHSCPVILAYGTPTAVGPCLAVIILIDTITPRAFEKEIGLALGLNVIVGFVSSIATAVYVDATKVGRQSHPTRTHSHPLSPTLTHTHPLSPTPRHNMNMASLACH